MTNLNLSLNVSAEQNGELLRKLQRARSEEARSSAQQVRR